MDLLRDDEDREIHHHGTSIRPGGEGLESTVIKVNPTPLPNSVDLVSHNEEIEEPLCSFKIQRKTKKSWKPVVDLLLSTFLFLHLFLCLFTSVLGCNRQSSSTRYLLLMYHK